VILLKLQQVFLQNSFYSPWYWNINWFCKIDFNYKV